MITGRRTTRGRTSGWPDRGDGGPLLMTGRRSACDAWISYRPEGSLTMFATSICVNRRAPLRWASGR
jgi:hypothetical protein